MTEKSSAELSIEIDHLETELIKSEEERDRVEIEITNRRRVIDEKRIEIRELENTLIKAKALTREHRFNLEQKKREFWRVRQSGL
jgi:hypothetical protein